MADHPPADKRASDAAAAGDAPAAVEAPAPATPTATTAPEASATEHTPPAPTAAAPTTEPAAEPASAKTDAATPTAPAGQGTAPAARSVPAEVTTTTTTTTPVAEQAAEPATTKTEATATTAAAAAAAAAGSVDMEATGRAELTKQESGAGATVPTVVAAPAGAADTARGAGASPALREEPPSSTTEMDGNVAAANALATGADGKKDAEVIEMRTVSRSSVGAPPRSKRDILQAPNAQHGHSAASTGGGHTNLLLETDPGELDPVAGAKAVNRADQSHMDDMAGIEDRVRWADISIDAALSRLQTTRDGLTSAEAEKRIQQYGPNRLPERHVNPFLVFLGFMWNPLSWAMEVAAIIAISLVDYVDFILIFSLLIVNSLIGYMEEKSAGNAVAALMSQLAPQAKVRRDCEWKQVPAADLVPGDIIRIRIGDIVPADLKLLEGDEMKIDQSSLTGESLPKTKYAGDEAFSGSIVKQGENEAVVHSTGVNTFFGKAAHLIDTTDHVGHLQLVLTQVGSFCIVSIVIWVFVELIVQFAVRSNPCDAPQGGQSGWCPTLENILVLIVGGIPIAMPTVLSVTMAIGATQLARKDAIVTRLTAIEELAGMEILCSDKTGTLTLNHLSVNEKMLFPVRSNTKDNVLLYAALSARVENNEPIDICVFESCPVKDTIWQTYTLLHYTPFDPVSKRTLAKIRKNDTGEVFYVAKGAPQVILGMDEHKEEIQAVVREKINDFASRGFRSLGIAHSASGDVPAAQAKWQMVGLIPLFDPPRHDSAETIRRAKAMGIDVKMITGDQLAIAKETARQLRMPTDIHTTAFFDQKLPPGSVSVDELVEKADGFAEVFPEHKFNIVKSLQDRGHIVGMTGDGVNDAPALKRADIGVAVAGATDAARSAADIVLLSPGLSVIIDAIIGSRKIFQRMKNYAMYSITMTIRVTFTFGLLTVIYDWYFPTIIIVILAILNDGTVMTISKDRVKPNDNPDAWKLKEVFITAIVLGLWLTLSTIILFEVAYKSVWFNSTFGLSNFAIIYVTPTCANGQYLPDQITTLHNAFDAGILQYVNNQITSYYTSLASGVFQNNTIMCLAQNPAQGIQAYAPLFSTTQTFNLLANSSAASCSNLQQCQYNCVCGEFLWRQESLRGLIYIQVSITGQATIFVTRAKRISYLERPAVILMAAFVIAQLVATLIGVYGFDGYPNTRASFRGCGWGYALVAWVWGIIWWLPLDYLKLLLRYLMSNKVASLYNRTTFTSTLNMSHPGGQFLRAPPKTMVMRASRAPSSYA